MTENIKSIEIEIEGKTFKSGTSTGRKLIPVAKSGDEDEQVWIDTAENLFRNLRTGKSIKHQLDNEGDELTLGELIDRNGITVEDLKRQRRLNEFKIDRQLVMGDFVKVVKLHNGEPQNPQYGVVQDIINRQTEDKKTAKISLKSGPSEILESKDNKLRMGPATMLSRIYDFQIINRDNEAVDEQLETIYDDIHRSKAIDDEAGKLSVSVLNRWKGGSSVEAPRGNDLHAKIKVTGKDLNEPVHVHCRNLFDAGWTASIEGNPEIEDYMKEIVIRAAKNNSPIPTHIRM